MSYFSTILQLSPINIVSFYFLTLIIYLSTIIYIIEFYKRGFPHAQILIFLYPEIKYPTPLDIDKIISCEIPNPELHPTLYNMVKAHMIHGPCGLSRLSSPYIKNRKCSRYFSKKFNETTIVDQDGI